MTQSRNSIRYRSSRDGRRRISKRLKADPGIEMLRTIASLRDPEKRCEKTFYDQVVSLIRGLTKTPLENSESEVMILFDVQSQAINFETFARGAQLGLDEAGRIVLIRVDAERLREGQRLWSIVGMIEGDAPDVALRHDDYLAEAYMSGLHGSTDQEVLG